MSIYITEKYAAMLTEEDVNILFNLLKKEVGSNRSKAARKCGVTDKATYDWEVAKYVKLSTKKKVLDASLRQNFIGTTEYLLERIADSNVDLIRTILSTLYANAIEATSIEDFRAFYEKFETLKNRNLGIIRDEIQTEVQDMVTLLSERAAELGVQVRQKSIDDFSAQEVVDALGVMGHIYSENPEQAELFAQRDIGLPMDVLKPIIGTFKDLCFTRKIQTNATADVSKKDHHVSVNDLFSTERTHLGIRYLPHMNDVEYSRVVFGKQLQGGIINEVTTGA